MSRYKSGTPRNLREIVKSLGVANIVEGTVQREGPRVRVVAQLIEGRTGTHRWSKTYDRNVADIFAIEDEIAQQIAHDGRRKLRRRKKLGCGEADNIRDGLCILRACARALDMTNKKDQKKCVVLLEEAVRRDPNFLLPHCGLGEAYERLYAQQNFLSEDERVETAARARAAIETALRLKQYTLIAAICKPRDLFLSHFNLVRRGES